MDGKRKSHIYGNCEVLSPEGNLMFRCLEKRATWYLDRNLAIIVNKNPLIIQLTFNPNGPGDKNVYLKFIRENKCIVCGSEDISTLTKHHLLPEEYRKHFPMDLKAHNSAYVVPICMNCHQIYETKFAYEYKKELKNKYSIEENLKVNLIHMMQSDIFTLLNNKKNIPNDKINKIKQRLLDNFSTLNICIHDKNTESDDTLRHYYDILENDKKTIESTSKTIVEKCGDLDEFSTSWVKHFIQSMNPKFMPDYLIEIVK